MELFEEKTIGCVEKMKGTNKRNANAFVEKMLYPKTVGSNQCEPCAWHLSARF